MRTLQKLLLATLFIIHGAATLYAQPQNYPAAGAAPKMATAGPEMPGQIAASDGTYDKFVLIRWEASEKATAYKVFRTANPKGSSFQEISNVWQKSTWLCDYTALPNVDYYYTVVASDGTRTSPMGPLDKGFLKKRNAVAIEENDLLAKDDAAYGAQRQLFLLIAGAYPNQENNRSGDVIDVEMHFQNIFEVPVPQSEIRYFLSENTILDWNDKPLGSKVISSIPANAQFTLKESIPLPDNLLPGTYYLIIVSSPAGEILSSKTAHAIIKITP